MWPSEFCEFRGRGSPAVGPRKSTPNPVAEPERVSRIRRATRGRGPASGPLSWQPPRLSRPCGTVVESGRDPPRRPCADPGDSAHRGRPVDRQGGEGVYRSIRRLTHRNTSIRAPSTEKPTQIGVFPDRPFPPPPTHSLPTPQSAEDHQPALKSLRRFLKSIRRSLPMVVRARLPRQPRGPVHRRNGGQRSASRREDRPRTRPVSTPPDAPSY